MKLRDIYKIGGRSFKYVYGDHSSEEFAGNLNLDSDIGDGKLTSLEGVYQTIGGTFSCLNNKLTSLRGGPKSVERSFSCSGNRLTSLEGSPHTINGYFLCTNNKLTSLKGAPQSVSGNFTCEYNRLTSLEGSPQSVGHHLGGDFYCSHNKLTSLKNIHKQIKSINGSFGATSNPITSHVIGLILIPGCKEIQLDNKKVADILNKYLGKGRAGLVDCAEELVKAGFPEMAKL